MVMMRMAAGIVEINGKIGSVRMRKDWCGQHIELLHTKHKPPTLWQLVDRAAFQKALRYWRMLADPKYSKELLQWRVYANEHPVKNKKGETIILSAYMMFMSVNIDRVLSGLEPGLSPYPIEDPPLQRPDMFIYKPNPVTIRIALIFPQPMWDVPLHTPDPADFELWLGLHVRNTSFTVNWNGRYELRLDIGSIDPVPAKIWMWYRQGTKKLSTRTERWYHSFTKEAKP